MTLKDTLRDIASGLDKSPWLPLQDESLICPHCFGQDTWYDGYDLSKREAWYRCGDCEKDFLEYDSFNDEREFMHEVETKNFDHQQRDDDEYTGTE